MAFDLVCREEAFEISVYNQAVFDLVHIWEEAGTLPLLVELENSAPFPSQLFQQPKVELVAVFLVVESSFSD